MLRYGLTMVLSGALLASATFAQTPPPLEPVEAGEGDTPPAPPPAPASRSVVIPAASLVPQEPEAPPPPAAAPAPPPAPVAAVAPLPPVPPAPPAPPPPPPPVDPAIAAFGFWGGIAESSWASQDGRSFFTYRWNPRHDAVIAEIADGSRGDRRSVVYREPAGDGMRIETTFADGRKTAGTIVEPDDVTAIQTDPARPAARTVYHRASAANVLVEQQARQADGSWLTTGIDSRHRITADERARLIAADRARLAAAPPSVPADAAPEERKKGLISRVGGVFGGHKPDPAPPPPPPADDPSAA